MSKALRESIIQFLSVMVVSWIIMYILPPKLFYEIYAPASFCWLFWLISFTIIGRGWPAVPPEGNWQPGMSKFGAGGTMLGLSGILAAVSSWFVVSIWPGIPLFPNALIFGGLLFCATLWYALIWSSYPVAGKSGKLNILVGFIVIWAITAVLWSTLVNYAGTPWANAPFDPKGLFNPDYLLGQVVWTICWIMILGPATQRYPFYKMGEPMGQIAQTIVAIVMGYICWNVSLNFMSPSFSFGALAGSIIAWIFYHSIFFGYFPNAKTIQPVRGIRNLIVVAIMVGIWIPLLKVILLPIVARSTAAGIPFDISGISMFYSLHAVAILLVVHTFFFFKMPLTPPGPPLGPEEIPFEGPANPPGHSIGK